MTWVNYVEISKKALEDNQPTPKRWERTAARFFLLSQKFIHDNTSSYQRDMNNLTNQLRWGQKHHQIFSQIMRERGKDIRVEMKEVKAGTIINLYERK
jgi:hypothetical protein